MEYIKSKDIYLLMRDILKLINPTLMEHGSRVAYIVYKMLQEENRYEEFELADIVMVATMHDIGAYKTEKPESTICCSMKRETAWRIPSTGISSLSICPRCRIWRRC